MMDSNEPYKYQSILRSFLLDLIETEIDHYLIFLLIIVTSNELTSILKLNYDRQYSSQSNVITTVLQNRWT